MLISMNSSIIIPVALASLWLFSMYMYAITSLLMLLCGCYDMYVVSQEPCVCVYVHAHMCDMLVTETIIGLLLCPQRPASVGT